LPRNQNIKNGEEDRIKSVTLQPSSKTKQEHYQKKKQMTLTTHGLPLFHIPHNDVAVITAAQRYKIVTVTAEGYRLDTKLVAIIL
jgi:hypothetical protein